MSSAPNAPQNAQLGTTSFDPHTSSPRATHGARQGIAGAARKSSSVGPLAIFVGISAAVAGYFVTSKWQRSGDRSHPTDPNKHRSPQPASQSANLERSGKVVTPSAQRMVDNAKEHADS